MRLKSETFKEDQFELYDPLVSDLRKDNRIALFSNFFIIIRRLLLLYTAMFIVGRPWIQTILFMVQNLASLVFLLAIFPYLDRFNNYLNLLNETVSLLVSYCIIQINDDRYTPDQKVILGDYIVNIIYFSWGMNFSIIAAAIVLELKDKIKHYYLKTLRWKLKCLRPKVLKKKRTEHPKYGRDSTIRSCKSTKLVTE